MATSNNPLGDPTLFGNDAAEDEVEEVFVAYAVHRPELDVFADPNVRLRIVRAYKGEGKSALLRLTRSSLEEEGACLVVSAKASHIAPTGGYASSSEAVQAWKQALLELLAAEVGSRIGIPWSGSSVALVKAATSQGTRKRNLALTILSGLKPTAKAGPVELGLASTTASSQGQILPADIQRWAEKGTPIWLFIDDVDEDFVDSSDQRNIVSAFFSACRELVQKIDGLAIRTTVRPNVWVAVRREYESLDKVEQYMLDISWSSDDIRTLLARRVEGWMERNDIRHPLPVGSEAANERRLVEQVFEAELHWGGPGQVRPPHVVISTLSKYRPRWAIELCKLAAASAEKRSGSQIVLEDLISNMTAFGEQRIRDCIAEFRPRCEDIEEMFTAFRGSKEQMSTAELIDFVNRHITQHISPRIDKRKVAADSREIASFLFEIGLFFAREELGGAEGYRHHTFADAPDLLVSRTNLDRGFTWEIHPIFRQALGVRDDQGREISKLRGRP